MKQGSTDRFQLAWNATRFRIKMPGKDYNQETRLHLTYRSQEIFISCLYLTAVAPDQANWFVKFDYELNNICPFDSRLEIAIALNCLLDSLKFAHIFDANLDVTACRKLIEKLSIAPNKEIPSTILAISNLLKINIMHTENALNSEIIRTSSITDNSVKFAIGDVDLTDGLITFLSIGGRFAEDTLIVSLDIAKATNLRLVDYNDDISLAIVENQTSTMLFGGIADVVDHPEASKLNINCRSHGLKLDEIKIPGLIIRIVKHEEAVLYVFSASGWPQDKLHIDGLDKNRKKRFFIILVPVANLDLNESIGIGDVTFAKLSNMPQNSLMNLGLETNPSYPRLTDDKVWAQVYISATDFYEAQTLGIIKIEEALDIVANVKSDSRPYYYSESGYSLVAWRRSDRLHRIFREPWIYIENAITKECIWASTQFTREGIKLNVSASLRNRLETGTEQLQALFQKEFNRFSDKERSLMMLFTGLDGPEMRIRRRIN